MDLFCLPWQAKKQTKQIHLLIFWENLRRANLLSVLSDFTGVCFHWVSFGLRTLSNRNQCQSQYFRITYMCRRPTKYVIHVHSNESFWCIVFSESTNLCCKSFRMKPKPYMVVISLFWSTHLFCWISWINRFVLQLFPNKATFRPNSTYVKSALPTYLDLNARIFFWLSNGISMQCQG